MSSVIDRYYKITEIILEALGLWPYQSSTWMRCIKAMIIRSLFLSGLLVQLAVFITHEFTLNLLIDVLSLIIPNIYIIIVYDFYYFNVDFFKEAMDFILCDWKSCKDYAELAIMNNYSTVTKILTQLFFFGGVVPGIIVLIMVHVVPLVLDIVLPLNESRPQKIYILVEYFLDPNKYYYLFAFHLVLTGCIAIVVMIGSSSMFLCLGFHACALFKITNYRMGIMIDKNILRISSPEREYIICERIICAVGIHLRSFQFCKLLLSNIENLFAVLIIIGVSSLSINLFRLLQEITLYDNMVDIFLSVGIIIIHFLYFFFGNHVGQLVMNNNGDICNTLYNLPWYIAPSNIQKLILFLLFNSHKTFYLSIQGVFNASYESFTTLITTTMSYFTVIHSTQQN